MSQDLLKIKLLRSRIGVKEKQLRVLRGLGLYRINQVVVRQDRPEVRGMVFQVSHLVQVEKAGALASPEEGRREGNDQTS